MSLSRFQRYFFVLASVLFFSTSCKAEYFWDVDAVYNNSNKHSSATLTADNKTVATLKTSQIKMLLSVRDKISDESKTYAKLLISDQPVLNVWAQSASGANTVTITFEMLKLIGEDSDMRAALMGHEFTHIALSHGGKKESADFILNTLAALAGGIVDAAIQSKSGVPISIGRDISNVTAQGISSAYSRSEELEADEYGTKWMINAGYDPQGAIRLHEELLRQNGDNNSFLTTHPTSIERITSIKQIIAQYEPTKKPVVAVNNLPSVVTTSELPTKSFENVAGQVGVILNVKHKYNYFIFSGTTASQLPEGTKVYVMSAKDEKIYALIERSVDGYYSATLDGSSSTVYKGEIVLIERER